MKIPSGYWDGGFGQKTPEVMPAYKPDTSGDQFMAQQGQQLGHNLLELGTQQIEFDGRLAVMDAQDAKSERERVLREQEAELKQLNQMKETSAAKKEYLGFDNNLSNLHQQLVDDPDVAPEDYPSTYRKKAEELKVAVLGKLNERQQLIIGNDLDHRINQGADQMFKQGQKEINDGAWADDLAAAEALINNPKKSAAEKIALIRDENFFADTGRDQHEIEAAKQKYIKDAAQSELDTQFNNTKTDLKAINNFISVLRNKDANGNYTYLPEMDMHQREQYVGMAMTKVQTLQSEARREAREAQTAAKQEAQALVMEYKDKVKTGWVPTTAADYKFVNQVRQYAALSPSLARQYDEISRNMTSMDYRLALKKKDPLGVTAAENGVQLQPLNVLDVNTLPQQIVTRLKVANGLGVKAVFTGPEMEAMTEYMKTLKPADQGRFIASVSKPLGPVIASATFSAAAEQARVKDPDLAVMFRLASSGKPVEAQLYAEGRGVLTSEKKDFLKDNFKTIQQEINQRLDKQLGSALTQLPEARNATKEAVATIYLAEAQRRNLPATSVDKDLVDNITKRVAGETTRTGALYFGSGKTTIVPQGMTADQFTNSIKAITPDQVKQQGGVQGMDDASAAKFLKSVAWHEVGSGYSFVKDGKPLYRADGKPFVWRFQ